MRPAASEPSPIPSSARRTSRGEIALPWVSFGSDAESSAPEGVFLLSSTHPRAYGNFARIFAKYVREEHVLTVEEAVRKLTSCRPTCCRSTRSRPLARRRIRRRRDIRSENLSGSLDLCEASAVRNRRHRCVRQRQAGVEGWGADGGGDRSRDSRTRLDGCTGGRRVPGVEQGMELEIEALASLRRAAWPRPVRGSSVPNGTRAWPAKRRSESSLISSRAKSITILVARDATPSEGSPRTSWRVTFGWISGANFRKRASRSRLKADSGNTV